MPYPTISGPYGLTPVNLIGGQPFAGSTRQIPLGSGSATAIFFGDVVKLNSSGTLDKDTSTNAATPVGVFLGCSYTDATYGKAFRQFYPGSITASDIVAYVCDDPDALFKVAVCSSGTTVSYVARTAVGENAAFIQNSGNTLNGDSRVAVNSTTATTSTWPLRVVDVVPDTQSSSGSFTEVIVKWNAGIHQYLNPTGT